MKIYQTLNGLILDDKDTNGNIRGHLYISLNLEINIDNNTITFLGGSKLYTDDGFIGTTINSYKLYMNISSTPEVNNMYEPPNNYNTLKPITTEQNALENVSNTGILLVEKADGIGTSGLKGEIPLNGTYNYKSNVNSLYFWFNQYRLVGNTTNYWTNWYGIRGVGPWNFEFDLNPSFITVTDSSIKASEVGKDGIKKGPTGKIEVKNFNGNGNIYFSPLNNSNINYSYNSNSKEISVKAIKTLLGKPADVEIEAYFQNSITKKFTVKFYNKPKFSDENTKSGNFTRKFNIKDADEILANLTLENYDQIEKILYINNQENQEGNFFEINASDFINIDGPDTSNKLKINKEGTVQWVVWKFYNKEVQTPNSEKGTYSQTISFQFIYYVTPKEISNFSYKWLFNGEELNNFTSKKLLLLTDNNGNVIYSPPMIGDLSYDNNTVKGGYCRGYKIRLFNGTLDDIVTNTNVSEENFVTNSNGYAKLEGSILRFLNISNIDISYYNKPLTLNVVPYFYFNKSKTILYDGFSLNFAPKIYITNAIELLPELKFPTLNKIPPYTPILLPNSERFGYFFDVSKFTSAGINTDDVDFGIKFNGSNSYKITMKNNPEYFSSNKIGNIILDVGKYISDNNLYTSNLKIEPFITLFTGTETEVNIYDTRTTNNINSTLDTSNTKIWKEPIATQGQEVEFFDYNNFYNFINKYKYLYNNIIWEVPKQNSGNIVKVDYWKSIADSLDIYAQNMQNFATDPTNYKVLWSLPKFKHKQGEIINTVNLKQNFYKLLEQYSNYESFATYNYLYNNSYSHNALHSYTHDQITNKEI